MYDADKLKFKLKLGLNLISPEDIQKWAIEQLADDSNNLLALDFFHKSKIYNHLSFLKLIQQVLTLFGRSLG